MFARAWCLYSSPARLRRRMTWHPPAAWPTTACVVQPSVSSRKYGSCHAVLPAFASRPQSRAAPLRQLAAQHSA